MYTFALCQECCCSCCCGESGKWKMEGKTTFVEYDLRRPPHPRRARTVGYTTFNLYCINLQHKYQQKVGNQTHKYKYAVYCIFF